MQNNIMVSVICLTYNHEKYIEKTIQSILNQETDFKFELLIHDDASTDGTKLIIKRYAELYPDIIIPIYQEENQYSQGINISSKFIYPITNGKYIAWCEGDDFWTEKYKLQKQVDFLEKNKKFIGCVHKYNVVDLKDEVKDIKTFGYYENEETYTFNDFFVKELPSQIGSLVCRNILKDPEIGYPRLFDEVKLQGDVKLFLYLLTYGDIYRLDEIMSAYRFAIAENDTSWSANYIRKPHNYKKFKELCHMEKIYKKIYTRNIKFDDRKLKCIIGKIMELKREFNLISFCEFMKMVFMQKGSLSLVFGIGLNKIKRGVK